MSGDPPEKRPPHEAWDALLKMAHDDAAEEIAALSDEELDQRLAARGMDPARVREGGQELAERLAAKHGVKLTRGKPRHVWIWIALALVAVVALVLAFWARSRGHSGPEPIEHDQLPPPPPTLDAAPPVDVAGPAPDAALVPPLRRREK